ncbi:cytochrome p450 3a21 [Phlyctema vagabunda]|uniref:Cytochrome p450 3a21 n=1 Tax=Phlyctema vagabunda TaxID=108571 RepID=A0ABR4PK07_9HELO
MYTNINTRLVDRLESYKSPRKSHEKYGDTYMIVALNMTYLKTANAEFITQVTTRRNDFPKPIKDYKVVDVFGPSMLSSEGPHWREHKRVIAPSFSEKSNKFAFEESLKQAEGMMNFWISQGDNTAQDVRVDDTSKDTAILSLNVICTAGFGVPQLWPNQSQSMLDGKGVSGFTGAAPSNGHALMFKDSLGVLLHGILNFLAFEPWMLKISPFKFQRDVYQAYDETARYFQELINLKKEQLSLGESDKGIMDLMGPMIKSSQELPALNDFKEEGPHKPILTRDEIISNSFIFFFAGHETSANSIHFSIIELALSLPAQQHMQKDIDRIIGQKPLSEISYHADMPRLYNSMVGAVLNEQLRVLPAIIAIPKIVTGGDQKIMIDKKEYTVPDDTFIHINTVGTNRNPRYWPYSPSRITGRPHDLDDFVPERWLPDHDTIQVNGPDYEHADKGGKEKSAPQESATVSDGLEKVSYESSSGGLFIPPKGAFTSFSEGPRACPGKRFAQVEITAVLTALFQRYSVELDVREWASDDEVQTMDTVQRRRVYERAMTRAREVLRDLEPVITLLMKRGDKVPVRFVERGHERFAACFAEDVRGTTD